MTPVRLSIAARRARAACVALAVTAGVAGCGQAAASVDPHGAVSFVIGARSNMPAPRLDGQAVAVLDGAVENQSYASIVVADGEPSVIGEKDLLIEGANDVARRESKRQNHQELETGIVAAKADDDEVDLLAALALSARTVHSEKTRPSTIVVVDSGLSTAGMLDFTQAGMLEADPAEVAQNLMDQDALPDLDGIEVVWQGMGDTAAPQESLSNGQRKNLEAIWAAILEAAGSPVTFEEHPLTKPGPGDLPTVTPVLLPDGPQCVAGSIVLTGADVAFKPDSAEFLDAVAARAVLEPIAEQLVAAAGVTVTLTGTTADVGDPQGRIDLSRQRAEAVLRVLAELGVPESTMTALGVGSEFPAFVPDHNPDGSLNPGLAAQNRKVIVTVAANGVLACA